MYVKEDSFQFPKLNKELLNAKSSIETTFLGQISQMYSI